MTVSVNIKKRLDRFNLDVSFEAENEILALLGTSGSGKSMTLKCIAGIETPDEGRIVLNGRVVFDSEKNINLAPQKRQVGYLFQQYALFPNMNIEKNIASGAHHLDKSTRKKKVGEMLDLMQLAGTEKRYPQEISGGQQQRVALARILINKPKILLLDEPFSALDAYLKWQVEMELVDILANYGGTSLFVSHRQNEVYRICDNVCVLSDGLSGPKKKVKQLFESPETLAECLISGCKNISKAKRIDRRTLRAIDWGVSLNTSQEVPEDVAYIGVREESIVPSNSESVNVFNCRVSRVVEDVFSTITMVDPPGQESEKSQWRVYSPKEKLGLLPAQKDLSLHIPPQDIMIFSQ